MTPEGYCGGWVEGRSEAHLSLRPAPSTAAATAAAVSAGGPAAAAGAAAAGSATLPAVPEVFLLNPNFFRGITSASVAVICSLAESHCGSADTPHDRKGRDIADGQHTEAAVREEHSAAAPSRREYPRLKLSTAAAAVLASYFGRK